MPQIPIPQKPRLARTGDNSVRLSGAPDLNWNVDHGLARMGESIGHAAQNIGSAVLRYAEESAEAENTLAAAEAERIQRDGDNKLDERIAANPGAYEQYGEWARETDAETSEKLRPVLGRMTEKFRRGYEERMLIRRQQAVSERVRLGNLARSKAQLQAFDAEFLEAARRGDAVTAEFMLARETGRLFGQEGADERRKQFDQVSSGYAARAMVDAGTPDAVERLEARNEDGSYKEYPHMEQGYRDSLIRYARGRQAAREVEQRDAFVARLLRGDAISEQEILDNPEYAQGTKNEFVSLLRAREGRTKSAREANAAGQRQKEARDAQDARDRMAIEIMDIAWNPDETRRREQYSSACAGIAETFLDHPGHILTLRRQLDESLKAFEKPDSSYRNSLNCQYAMAKLDGMKDTLFSKLDEPGWFERDDDTEMVKNQNYAMFKVRLDEFLRLNPKATQAEIDTFMENTKKQINETQVSRVLDRLAGIEPEAPAPPKKGVFDSRKNPPEANGLRGFVTFSEDGRIRKNYPDGEIDKADIVKMGKNKAGRVVWELDDGRKVFADEYE